MDYQLNYNSKDIIGQKIDLQTQNVSKLSEDILNYHTMKL
jgi:hypothetical protein